MTDGRNRGGPAARLAATMVAIAIACPAAAQVANGAEPAPLATASPALPVPPAPVIVLPTPSATPRPTPVAKTTPLPRPSASPTPRATASPSPAPSPAVVVPSAPMAGPTIAVTPTPTPAPAVTPAPAPDTDWPLVAAAAAAVVLGAIGWVVLRRRSSRAEPAADRAAIAAAPAAPPVARARLAMTFRPIRAGLNLLSAVSENEVVIANVGDAVAEDIRLLTQLTNAHAGQDAELAAIYAAPIGRPAIPAFALAPGEERAIISVAALPRDAIRPLTAAGRPMVVPIVAVNILYATAGREHQLAQAFAVGVERVDSAKLAPFWLDTPPRTVEQVAARPHAAALER